MGVVANEGLQGKGLEFVREIICVPKTPFIKTRPMR